MKGEKPEIRTSEPQNLRGQSIRSIEHGAKSTNQNCGASEISRKTVQVVTIAENKEGGDHSA
jgi:hypothetical protein